MSPLAGDALMWRFLKTTAADAGTTTEEVPVVDLAETVVAEVLVAEIVAEEVSVEIVGEKASVADSRATNQRQDFPLTGQRRARVTSAGLKRQEEKENSLRKKHQDVLRASATSRDRSVQGKANPIC